MKVTTIDEVIEALDAIIEKAKDTKRPDGYFAALYRKVTKSVKERMVILKMRLEWENWISSLPVGI